MYTRRASENLIRCCICFTATTTLDEQERCILCRTTPLPFESIKFIWEYEGAAKDLITTMKYKPSLKLTHSAGINILVKQLSSKYSPYEIDCIVPIPSSAMSRRERPFQVCLVLAEHMMRGLRLPCIPKALRHRGYKAPQASLTHKERLKNVAA